MVEGECGEISAVEGVCGGECVRRDLCGEISAVKVSAARLMWWCSGRAVKINVLILCHRGPSHEHCVIAPPQLNSTPPIVILYAPFLSMH